MAKTYIIGDVQGCFDELQSLLRQIKFDPTDDKLWFTGDLVNRGPCSLEVLRFVKDLGDAAVSVLGNHDLHMLAVASGHEKQRKHDTFKAVFAAPDREELLDWLRYRPLIHYDPELDLALMHAGLPPQWDVYLALSLASEVETVLRSDNAADFFANMYGNEPAKWQNSLAGWDRLRFITNCFTRIRFCTADGVIDMKEKRGPGSQAAGLIPWFEIPGRRSTNNRIVFGHWAALGSGVHDNVVSVDSGCAWGGALTAAEWQQDGVTFHSLPCQAVAAIK